MVFRLLNSYCPPTMFLHTKLINSGQIRSCNLGCSQASCTNRRSTRLVEHKVCFCRETTNTGPGTRGPKDSIKDPRTQSLEGCVALHQLKYNYTANLCQCYTSLLSCTSSLCTPKVLFILITDNAKLSSDFFDSWYSLI